MGSRRLFFLCWFHCRRARSSSFAHQFYLIKKEKKAWRQFKLIGEILEFHSCPHNGHKKIKEGNIILFSPPSSDIQKTWKEKGKTFVSCPPFLKNIFRSCSIIFFYIHSLSKTELQRFQVNRVRRGWTWRVSERTGGVPDEKVKSSRCVIGQSGEEKEEKKKHIFCRTAWWIRPLIAFNTHVLKRWRMFFFLVNGKQCHIGSVSLNVSP